MSEILLSDDMLSDDMGRRVEGEGRGQPRGRRRSGHCHGGGVGGAGD